MQPKRRGRATRWSDEVRIKPQVARSANVERDASDPLDGYLPTVRAIEVVRRWAHAMHGEGTTRAWSITGPYGSGKSSLALLLSALVSPLGSDRQLAADHIVRSVEPELADRVLEGRESLGSGQPGFLPALVTGDREPVERTVSRALVNALSAVEGGRAAAQLEPTRHLLESAPAGSGPADRLIELIAEIAREVPLLIVIDEFGKTLEHHVRAGAGDGFLLQRIAELGAGRHPLPVFLFTLQHLSFSDYVSGTADAARREWAKVQGRFEDVAFAPTRDEMVTLVRRAFEDRLAGPTADRIDAYAARAATVLVECGLDPLLPDPRDSIAETFPLHPTTLLGVPELCRSHGQFERSLFSFLASDGAGSVGEQLARPVDDETIPNVTLAAAYDYFVGSARASAGSSAGGGRWLETEARVREASRLSAADQEVLKTVAVLNLISAGGTLRASKGLVAYALSRPDESPDIDRIAAALERLEAAGFLTYRAFADEYRVWQGSDFDIGEALARARSGFANASPARIVAEAVDLEPVAALRHAQETGTHRFFEARFADASSTLSAPGPGADGMLVFWLDEDDPDPSLLPSEVAVVARSQDVRSLIEACLEAASVHHILTSNPALAADWVARRELVERHAAATATARTVFRRVFDPAVCSVSIIGTAPIETASRWSRIVSDVCDAVFSEAPIVRNEMLSRDELTRQAARARRDLIDAIVERPGEARLGIDGYGPERALYESVLTGDFHRAVDGGWRLVAPTRPSGFHHLWARLDRVIEASPDGVTAADLEDIARAAPVGLPRSAFPIVLSVLLSVRADDLAIFQDGTYLPVLSSEVLERLTKAPSRFVIRAIPSSEAVIEVLDGLSVALGIPPRTLGHARRNPSVLSVVGPLLAAIRDLPPYTTGKRDLSPTTLRVRTRLLETRDPARLVFEELPIACGLAPLSSDVELSTWLPEYSRTLAEAVRELRGAYRQLLLGIASRLAREFGTSAEPDDVRREARSRAAMLRERIFEPRLRAFAYALSDEELEAEDWLSSVAMSVVGPPPPTWREDDEVRFELELKRLMRSLGDAESLNFESIAHHDTDAFARRVTVSEPDGHHWQRTVWLDETETRVLGLMVDDLLKQASMKLGRTADDAVLAMLSERLARADDTESKARNVADVSPAEQTSESSGGTSG